MISFRPYLLPPVRPSKPEPLSRHCPQTLSHSPIINELWLICPVSKLQIFQRIETRAWLDCPQNHDHQVAVECVHVCGSKNCAPSWPRCLLCAFESPPLYYYLHLFLPLLLTLNKPSSPWRVSELQLSLGKGIDAAVLPDPVLPHSSFSITLAGWDTKLSLPLTFPV